MFSPGLGVVEDSLHQSTRVVGQVSDVVPLLPQQHPTIESDKTMVRFCTIHVSSAILPYNNRTRRRIAPPENPKRCRCPGSFR